MLTVALAKTAVENGSECPLTVEQIDQVIARYHEYQGMALAFVRAKFSCL